MSSRTWCDCSESLPDLLSQARGLGIGAVLANQYLAQLPESVRAAVLGTARSQVAFQVEYDDARLLERRFEPSLAADDLMGQATVRDRAAAERGRQHGCRR